MRNVTVIENRKRKNFRQLFITLAVASIGFLAIFIMVSVMYTGFDYNNVTQIEGIASEVTSQEESYTFLMDDGESYSLNSIVAGKVDAEEISTLQEQNITLYIMDDEVIGFESDSYTLAGEEGFRLIKDNYKVSMIIIGVLAGLLLLGTIASLIKFLTEKKMVRGDVFKLINTRQLAMSQVRKQYIKFAMMPLILALIFLIPMVIYSEPIGTMFYIFLGIFLACLVSGIVVSAIILPFINKREIEEFDKALNFDDLDESKEHNRFIMDVGNYLPFELKEEGILYREEFEADFLIESLKNDKALAGQDLLKVRSDLLREIKSHPKDENDSTLKEDTFIKYNELNLVTKVVFRSSNEPIKIFVCSQFDESQYPTLRNDLFFEFDEDLYYFIKKYNIKVVGLERCLQKRREYMEKYSKGKVKYFDVTDNGEVELFTKIK